MKDKLHTSDYWTVYYRNGFDASRELRSAVLSSFNVLRMIDDSDRMLEVVNIEPYG